MKKYPLLGSISSSIAVFYFLVGLFEAFPLIVNLVPSILFICYFGECCGNFAPFILFLFTCKVLYLVTR
jgi:hypothetical protein